MRAHRLSFAVLLLAVLASAPAYQEPGPGKAERAAGSFVGEQLAYKIEWDPPAFPFFFLPKMDAGEIDLQLIGGAEYKGRKALKVQFNARSSGMLVRLAGMKIEDHFVFLTEPESFCTFSGWKSIREGKRKRQIEVHYLRETRQLHIREVDEAPIPPKLRKDETKDDIPACIHDPFSALYLFRRSRLEPRFTRNFMLANDDKIKEVRAVVERQEKLPTPSGKIDAWRVSTAALMGGLFKEGGQFKIWFSADEKKVPLQFEVKVRFGKILGKLKPAV